MKTHEYRHGNAIIRVHRPELTAEEKNRRTQAVETALQRFGKVMKKREN